MDNSELEQHQNLELLATTRSGKSVIASTVFTAALESEEEVSVVDEENYREPMTLTMTPEQGRKWRAVLQSQAYTPEEKREELKKIVNDG